MKAAGISLWTLLLAGAAAAQPAPMTVESVQMLDCEPVSTRPCFRAKVNFGAAVRNIPDDLLRAKTAVDFDGKRVLPFYISTQDRAASGRKPRTALILLDISGSMTTRMSNGATRIEVAKVAVDRFVSSLDPELDEVAVAPFDNHGVIPGIQRARFVAGGEAARGLVAAIPNPRGDTALYAAIFYGIEALELRQRRDSGREYQLITITDGKDDLGRDPDRELRERPISIETVAAKADRSSVGVYLIGIGGGEPDTGMLAPLEMISIHHAHMVQEPDELMEVLARARPALATRMLVSFLSPYATAGQLEGRNHQVRVTIGQAPEQVNASGSWAPPEAMISPQAREECSPAEKQALIKAGPPADEYTAVIRPLATAVVFACILLLCWFAMPRLIWPEQYAAELPRVDGGSRWASGRQAGNAAKAAAAGGARQETDATYVVPRQVSDPRSRFK
jgi:Mg-chelatase subunit ChlD